MTNGTSCLGFLLLGGVGPITPHTLVEVRQLQLQLMVNVKLLGALGVWSGKAVHPDVVLSGCLYIQPAESDIMGVTCWHSRRYLGQAHSQQHQGTPSSSPGSLWVTAALDKVQLQWHEGPHVGTACLSPSQVLACKVTRKSSYRW